MNTSYNHTNFQSSLRSFFLFLGLFFRKSNFCCGARHDDASCFPANCSSHLLDYHEEPLITSSIYDHILADEVSKIDPALTTAIQALKSVNAHKCWHKHSTFLEHLTSVHKILLNWNQGLTISRVGLFHSAYSNSYVNLALFDPNKPDERSKMRDMIGADAEELVHIFCIIDRQAVVVNTLLKNGFIPGEGLTVPHVKKPENTVYLSPEILRMLLVFTMADVADQYFGWQDQLFGGHEEENSMLLPGEDLLEKHDPTALWPGVSKPGLYMSYLSELGRVASTFVPKTDYDVVAIPPIFENCTFVLSRKHEAESRDLYWQVVTKTATKTGDLGDDITKLSRATQMNPWAFEPFVMLAQKYMHIGNFELAYTCAGKALELQKQWGTSWDKRLAFGAWVAWTNVLHQRARDKLVWPKNSWDVNNFGLVK